MSDLDALNRQLDAEFAQAKQQIQKYQQEVAGEYQAREERFKTQFQPAVERLRGVWRPRLEALIQRFRDVVHAEPVMDDHSRSVTLRFDTELARVQLKFAASHDLEVRNLVLTQDLVILPILMEFDNHSRLEVPLANLDEQAVTRWFDERLIAFTRTWIALHQNQYYLKDQMVVDPVAQIRMPKYAAATTLEWKGKTYYFIGDQTRQEFERKNNIPPAKA